VCKRCARDAKFKSLPLATLDESALEIEQVWNDVWEKQQLERAMDAVRQQHHNDKSWQAFEGTIVQGRPPQEVADQIGISVSGVYKARDRIGAALRQRLKRLARVEG
jgi:hypothetical protein